MYFSDYYLFKIVNGKSDTVVQYHFENVFEIIKRSDGPGTTAMRMQRTTSGAAGNGMYTTIKNMRGAAGIGLGTTAEYLRRTTSAAANNGLSATTKYLVN